MKPHITNLRHQQFCRLMETAISNTEEIPDEDKTEVSEKIAELKSNKNELEEIYKNYQLTLKELSDLLDEYDKVQQTSRIHLRKIQLWLKYANSKITKTIF